MIKNYYLYWTAHFDSVKKYKANPIVIWQICTLMSIVKLYIISKKKKNYI